MQRIAGVLPVVALVAGFGTALQAAPRETVQFSAQVVQGGPQGKVSEGRMYVAGERLRLDLTHDGRHIVNIVDRRLGTSWTLFPDAKVYLKHAAPVPPQGATQEEPGNPCRALPNATCRKLGEETVAGRAADKWEIRVTRGGQSLVGTQWIDKERHTPLRQDMPGGEHTELKFLGMETVDGRSVEKWESLNTRGSQAAMRSYQWYDPQLNVAVRQELPGGYYSELKHIRVGPQPQSLFRVPQGYKPAGQPPADASARGHRGAGGAAADARGAE